jgi:hypothetical protein
MSTAPDPRLRRDVEQLSVDGLISLREAFRQSMALDDDRGFQHHAGIYGLPMPIYSMHNQPLFLPWNRAWLYFFEQALRDRVPEVTLPWWDWSWGPKRSGAIPRAFDEEVDAGGPDNPLRSGPIPPLEGMDDTPRRTRREPARDASLLPHVDELRAALAITDYEDFAATLEALHNRVHMWVGGDVAQTTLAAYDPLTWSLSVMVDHVWSTWQQRHPDAGLPAELTDRALAPFSLTAGQTLDVTALGYDYPPLRLRGTGPSLTRYASDLVDPSLPAEDLLGIEPEVDALAALITQREVEPPLAIGLFGDWGSGKSFFMRLLRQRIGELSAASRDVAADATAFCGKVDQVTYDAWHHADADLSSSLVGETMNALVTRHPDLKLPVAFASMRDRTAQIEQTLADANTARAEAEETCERLKQARRRAPRFLRRFIGGRLHGLPAYAAAHPLTLVPSAVGAVALFVGVVVLGDSETEALITTIGGVVTFVGGLLAPLIGIESRATAADRGLAEAGAAYRSASHELSELYTGKLGLGAVLRENLAEFSRQVEASGELDRVVLYIDDLDRCDAQRVVAVLEAVHVLLAFKLFVVVVGVDSRWLLSSLRSVYRAQFDPGSSEDASWVTTPQNYLEKIFQIPYSVPPMHDAGFRQYVESMLAADLARDGGGALLPGDVADGPTAPSSADAEHARGSDYATTAGSAVRLRPRTLEISREEAGFLATLGTIVSSPRAGKRLINTYRLLRAPLDDAQLAAFEGPEREYRVVASLLAIMIGAPAIASRVFGAMLAAPEGLPWTSFSQSLRAATPTGIDAGDWAQLTEALETFDQAFETMQSMEPFRRWVWRVARYSFETSRLTARPLNDPPHHAPT